ncbi:MAG: ABC transporter permease [Chloroflexi bacterium]|nr:ABC transporter permease [Chloroflexota bacterium]
MAVKPPQALTRPTVGGPPPAVPVVTFRGDRRARLRQLIRYVRRNPSLGVGVAILCGLLLFVGIGYLVYDMSRVAPLSVPANRSPAAEYPLGTDRQGRDILAVMIAGTPLTLRIGLIAGTVGVGIGMILAFVAAYYGGLVDGTIKLMVDVLLTIPGLLVLVLIAVSLPQGGLTVDQMALVVAALAWLWPARTIRSQVLVMRERAWVEIARLSGMSGPEIIFKEMMPNLLPYIAASFVGAVAAAILASIGLEALGLGPFESPTIGMTIYWNIYYSSILHGLWWWLMPPIVLIILVFVSLFLISAGLDEWANPRLRRRV